MKQPRIIPSPKVQEMLNEHMSWIGFASYPELRAWAVKNGITRGELRGALYHGGYRAEMRNGVTHWMK